MRRLLPFLVILLALSIPHVATQGAFAVHVQDNNPANPPGNATVVFSNLNGGDPKRFETDDQGKVEADVEAGAYRVRAYVKNESGELWYDKELDVDPEDSPLVLVRNQPSLGRRHAEIVGAESAPDGSAVYVPIGTNLDVNVPIKYDGPANKTIIARATILKGNATIHEGTIGITNLTASGWINGTLAASTASPYHTNESITTLRIFLFQNDTTILFDAADPLTVIFRDGCLGAAVQLRATVENTTIPICAAPDQATTWQSWAADANQLTSMRRDWNGRFQANKTTWSFAETRAAWVSYLNETAPLRSKVVGPLDAAQTDIAGVPTWQQLEVLRTVVDRNHTAIEKVWQDAIEIEADQAGRAAYVARAQTFGLIVLVAAILGGATVGAMAMMLRAWKRRAEYWIGYSGRDQESSPLWLTLAVGGALAIVGFILSVLSPLWGILGGGP